MILFPAIDILNKQCVRLYLGQYDKVTIYGDPVDMALKWESEGAQYLHIVDLNGAKSGNAENLAVIKEIVKKIKIPVQIGGGIRTADDVKQRIEETGVKRIILGTALYQNREMLESVLKNFSSEQIVCGIDAKDGKVAIKGWLETADISPLEFGKQMKNLGFTYVVYTDISRDGALCGINTEACAQMARQTGLKVIASGGLSSLTDIKNLKNEDMYGAILGKALYNKNFTLQEALKVK